VCRYGLHCAARARPERGLSSSRALVERPCDALWSRVGFGHRAAEVPRPLPHRQPRQGSSQCSAVVRHVGVALAALSIATLAAVALAGQPSSVRAQEVVDPAAPSGGDARAAAEMEESAVPPLELSSEPVAQPIVPWPQASASLRVTDDRSVQIQAERRFSEFRGTLHWPWFSWISTYFGEVGPTSPHGHAGLDIAGEYGDPVVAPCAGLVIQAGWHPAYGNNVILDNGTGLVTRYGHFADIAVEEGEQVVRGQLIGHVGSSGYSTGPHVHFETWRDGVLVDPLTVLPSPYPARPYPERPLPPSSPYLARFAPADPPEPTSPGQ
jgi:murein DD-endopeptidase MepM/ murein hydrolase activator NlpD